MQGQVTTPLTELRDRFTEFVPDLVAGLLVLAAGVVLGWLVKRAVVRILIWLRLDRLGGKASWRAAFGKGDVRAALYGVVGTVAMALVILPFLDNALDRWGLAQISRFIDAVIVFVPNLALVGLIVGVGVVLTNVAADRIEDALEEEEAPHPRLIGRIFKLALLAVVGALALWQLNFAREIVLAAFLISFGAVGVAFAMAVGLGTAKAIQRGWETLLDKRRDR